MELARAMEILKHFNQNQILLKKKLGRVSDKRSLMIILSYYILNWIFFKNKFQRTWMLIHI